MIPDNNIEVIVAKNSENIMTPIDVIEDNIIDITTDAAQEMNDLTSFTGVVGNELFENNSLYNDPFDNIPDNNDQNFIDFGA